MRVIVFQEDLFQTKKYRFCDDNWHKMKSYFTGPVTAAVIFFALFGKFCITVSFAVMVLYTRELFPTNLR